MNINQDLFQITDELQKGWDTDSPIPTRIVSNEEFPPLPQTLAQRHVEHLIEESAAKFSRALGLNRRDFLKTTGGMAVAFLAMNSTFGRFFDILEVEAADPAAFAERSGLPPFIFDVQTHYVSRGYGLSHTDSARGLLAMRQRARDMVSNPDLARDKGTMEDLDWVNFIKEVFLDSDTSLALISTPPGPYPQEAVVPPKEMTHIRNELNRLTESQRMLAHGLITPQLGKADIDFMVLQAETLKVDAWKCYTGHPPKGFKHGWFMDDEKLAYPALEQARSLRIPRICVHKGLPMGPVEDFNHPRDLIKAAKDFPDLDFLAYHSGFKSARTVQDAFKRTGDIPWTSEFCRMKKAEPRINNIYMEMGSTFAQLVSLQPELCAHLLGQILQAFGEDHVLWGTDSIWYGSPRWQIEAFRRFQIPDALIERYGYPSLTKEIKAKIFGLNAARVFGVDITARRNAVPTDYLSKIKMAYREESPSPSHRLYGWVAR